MTGKPLSGLGLAAAAAMLGAGPVFMGDSYGPFHRGRIPVPAKPKGKDRTKIKAARKQKHISRKKGVRG